MDEHIYKVKVEWTEGKKGIVEGDDGKKIEISTPADFGGPSGYWSPEELFVSSIASCLMTSFLYFVLKNNVKLISYENKAIGKVEKVEKIEKKGYVFTDVEVEVTAKVDKDEDMDKIKTFLALAEKYCLISNSTDVKISVKNSVISE